MASKRQLGPKTSDTISKRNILLFLSKLNVKHNYRILIHFLPIDTYWIELPLILYLLDGVLCGDSCSWCWICAGGVACLGPGLKQTGTSWDAPYSVFLCPMYGTIKGKYPSVTLIIIIIIYWHLSTLYGSDRGSLKVCHGSIMQPSPQNKGGARVTSMLCVTDNKPRLILYSLHVTSIWQAYKNKSYNSQNVQNDRGLHYDYCCWNQCLHYDCFWNNW